jgi:hypothetical protein
MDHGGSWVATWRIHFDSVIGCTPKSAAICSMVTPLAVVLTEATVGLQVQESTAEVPELESNVDRTCLGIDLDLLVFVVAQQVSF